jgi:hypothetical protein
LEFGEVALTSRYVQMCEEVKKQQPSGQAIGASTVARLSWLRTLLVKISYGLSPIANKLRDDRTYITPPDSAGVAISNSPMEFVAMRLKVGPA